MKQMINYQNQTVEIIQEKNIVNHHWSFLPNNKRCFVITDANLFNLYSDLLNTIPHLIGIKVISKIGDKTKNIRIYQEIIQEMLKYNVNRNDIVIAFGGGVITDLGGFIAGTYQRGIEYINIPTSLIGMIDASIGGKCGINYKDYKNQLGLFYHPWKIIIDENLLSTLPQLEYYNGLAEAIKYAVIADEKLFQEIENETFTLTSLIKRCIDIKIQIVLQDEKDNYLRHLLNFGHTYGHIVESSSKYTISHGQAIAIGMTKEITDFNLQKRLIDVLSRYFELDYPLNKKNITNYLLKDKKRINQEIKVVKIVQIGQAQIITKKVEDLINEYLR